MDVEDAIPYNVYVYFVGAGVPDSPSLQQTYLLRCIFIFKSIKIFKTFAGIMYDTVFFAYSVEYFIQFYAVRRWYVIAVSVGFYIPFL